MIAIKICDVSESDVLEMVALFTRSVHEIASNSYSATNEVRPMGSDSKGIKQADTVINYLVRYSRKTRSATRVSWGSSKV